MANEDKATRYHRLRRRASLLASLSGAAYLALLVLSGLAVRLRELLIGPADAAGPLSAMAYAVVLGAGYVVIRLPALRHRDLTLERRYGLSSESEAHWWLGELKGVGVGLVILAPLAGALVALLRWSPERWWLAAAALLTLGLVIAARLAPTVLLPLFYDIRPLDRPSLTARLVALAGRCGAPVLGVFEWRVGDRTRKAGAALVGLGAARRILVSDTLLADHSDEEIEVVLAHELAHHVHRDIWTALAVQAVLVLAGCYLADRALAVLAGPLGLPGRGDAASLPLLALAGGGAWALLVPVANAVSRSHERRADRFAVATTNNAGALVSALRRLGATNLAEEQPSPLVEALFHTHPSLALRIAAARALQPQPARGVDPPSRTRPR